MYDVKIFDGLMYSSIFILTMYSKEEEKVENNNCLSKFQMKTINMEIFFFALFYYIFC